MSCSLALSPARSLILAQSLNAPSLVQYWDSETTLRELDFAGYFADTSKSEEGSAEGKAGKEGGKEGGVWPELLTTMKDQNQKLALSALGGCAPYLRSIY